MKLSKAIVRTHPWLRGVEINAFHPLRAGKKLSLHNAISVSKLANSTDSHLQLDLNFQ